MSTIRRRRKESGDKVEKTTGGVTTFPTGRNGGKNMNSTSCTTKTGILYLVIVAMGTWIFILQQQISVYRRLVQTTVESNEIVRLEKRSSNFDWVVNPASVPPAPRSSDDSSVKHLLFNWTKHLSKSTPDTWQNKKSGIDCRYGAIIPKKDLSSASWSNGEALNKASKILKECGFVYLDDLFTKAFVDELRDFYVDFVSEKNRNVNSNFRYPCQGKGRIEYMMPFAPPFNESNSAPYADHRIRAIVSKFLGPPFKLELMTVINSLPGSGDQRWHQGWRYLFHETEHLPPYAIVVTVPLDDVTVEMGGTQFCPRKKLRFYHGWRCNDPVQAATTKGTVVMFDYKTLHRGPANLSNRDRPMISMVFSKSWFLNSEAFVNRGISLVQSLHQRRYMEQWYWHPERKDDFFQV